MTKSVNNQQNSVIALKKAGSLIQTMIKMIESDRYCVDIMQQNLAAMGLLKRVNENLMDKHLHTCFIEGIKSGNQTKKNQMIAEIESVMRMGNR